MARIFFSTISGIPNTEKLPCFYEGFVNALLKEGNDVMLMVTNNFIDDAWHTNDTASGINKGLLNDAIKKFNPELVITFNNSLYEEIPKLVNCPIAIWGSDSPAIYSAQKQIKKNVDRYHFICPTGDFYSIATKYFNVKPERLHTVYFATDFVTEPLEQDKNITFIGTNFSNTGRIKEFLGQNMGYSEKERHEFRTFFSAYQKDVLKMPKVHLKELGIDSEALAAIPHSDLLNLVSGNFRVQTLQNICDLGLQLYGSKSWDEVLDFSLNLALCFTEQEISSVQENQNVYNQSKIGINITHAQAKNAFGWRVRDIMATNACLVSDYRAELTTQFGEYVKIPVYHTPYEARELCQKLLKDDVWRKEIVEGSQLAIEKGHRFKHRFAELEKIFGVKLEGDKKGQLIQLHAEHFMPRVVWLEKQNDILRQRMHIMETHPRYAAINFIYKMCAKTLPRPVKRVIRKIIS
jgi:hypothetical protein